MDTAVKKNNKENSKPEAGPKKTESRNVIPKQKAMRPAPLRSKNEPRQDSAGDKAESKAPLKPSKSAGSNDSDPTQRKTLSQAFRTEQTLRHRKLVLETQKPPSSVPPKPLLPGTYKGRVVQSKIDCFRKPASGHEKKPSESKTNAEAPLRSKSATTLSASSRAGIQSSVASRAKSGSNARVNMQKTVPQNRMQTKAPARTATISTRPSTISNKPFSTTTKPSTITKPSTVSTKPSTITKPSTVSTKPSTVSTKPSTVSTKPSTVSTKPSTVSTKPSTGSTKPSTVSSKPPTVSRKPLMMSARPPTVTSFIRKKEPSKPAAAASEQKPQKSITSAISQYRVRVESAEERRLKLAEWLASKGKALKRPVMTEKSVLQTSKPRADAEDEAESSEGAESSAPEKKPVFSSSPSHILNTTLDLLDDSDTEPLAEHDIRMESLVINLCERLEAMETPSSCQSHTKAGGNADGELKEEEETAEYAILEEEELSERKPTDPAVEEKKEKKSVSVEEEEKEKKAFESEEDEEEMMDATPAEVLDACVVKYSVKTTRFLQSVKKRMEGEMVPGTPGSRRKSSIKDLKFLTPVRRSSRIHRNSSRLPGLLNEHDPCVSSLAELELLDAADSNAYIYRKNPALLQHLPDQPPEPQGSEHTANKHTSIN